MFHTVDEDFDHFLSYSGMRNEPQDTLRKLYIAFKAAWDPCHSAQHDVQPNDAAEQNSDSGSVGRVIG